SNGPCSAPGGSVARAILGGPARLGPAGPARLQSTRGAGRRGRPGPVRSDPGRKDGRCMRQGVIRIGIVGAGAIARARHLPGFKALPGVKVVGVCNQHRDSATRVAREFEIPRIFENWEHLVESDEIDAVVIGTWPYLHCPITME